MFYYKQSELDNICDTGNRECDFEEDGILFSYAQGKTMKCVTAEFCE